MMKFSSRCGHGCLRCWCSAFNPLFSHLHVPFKLTGVGLEQAPRTTLGLPQARGCGVQGGGHDFSRYLITHSCCCCPCFCCAVGGDNVTAPGCRFSSSHTYRLLLRAQAGTRAVPQGGHITAGGAHHQQPVACLCSFVALPTAAMHHVCKASPRSACD
jgi:hypothetical protein